MTKSKNSIKYGTIFKLGRHYLAYGDCRDKELVARLVGNLKIKAAICDVPYAVAAAESKENFQPFLKNKPIANDHLQSDEEYQKFTVDWIEAIKPYLARKNAFYIFNCDKMVFALREGIIQAGLKFGQLLIWVKTQAVLARPDYAPQHEIIVYGWLGAHEFLKSKDKSVIVYPRPNKSPYHPTTKPIGLIRRLILNSTRIGDVVFDGFLGSGTCLLACQQTERICLGVEIDPEYVQTAIDRFEAAANIKAERLI